ncbi:MAG: CPXCG motif-containing cysteine-rich protein [Gammaproteobacteria bacterium]
MSAKASDRTVSLFTESAQIYCPYCGEKIEVIIDASVEQQHYTEDCSVCCRPMELTITVAGNEILVSARRDDE